MAAAVVALSSIVKLQNYLALHRVSCQSRASSFDLRRPVSRQAKGYLFAHAVQWMFGCVTRAKRRGQRGGIARFCRSSGMAKSAVRSTSKPRASVLRRPNTVRLRQEKEVPLRLGKKGPCRLPCV